MTRCPTCDSIRVVIVLGPTERRAFCGSCGCRWIQAGSEQRAVRRIPGSASTARPA